MSGDLQHELTAAISAAREAGGIVRSVYEGSYTVQRKAEAGNSPLTEADLRSNDCIQQHIARAFPDDGWLSEETTDSAARLDKERVWIIDPLDGTREFVNRIPEFVVCIGLAINGEAVLGVEYNPMSDELFAGARGIGTTLNGNVVRPSSLAELPAARVLASRSEDKRGEWDEFRSDMQVTLTGSVAYKLALIAAGRADATFSLTPKNEWDVCAGAALITAAGGRMTDRYGRPLRFNQTRTLLPGIIASNGPLHEPILRLLQERGKMQD